MSSEHELCLDDDIAISLEDVSKSFQIYNVPHDRLKQFVLPRMQRLLGRNPRQYFREFHALRNISFKVGKGETIGVVGRNGSGKSTLLQIICGTLFPTSGLVEINGRIAALLELGSGFNPEFTGRENVYMSAAVLGLGRDEIDSRFDGIAAFADIGDFIEQPVKTYSSGMYIRLAFAVAINVDPDILIIDEALSVGDEAFQRRCFSRLQQIKENGGTIFFVSHAAAMVVEFCDRAILLDGGEQILSGQPKKVVSNYHKLIYAGENRVEALRQELQEGQNVEAVPGTRKTPQRQDSSDNEEGPEIRDFYDVGLVPKSTVKYEQCGADILDPHIEALSGERVNVLTRGRDYDCVYGVNFTDAAFGVRAGCMIKTITGLELGGVLSHPVGQGIEYVERGRMLDVRLRFRCTLLAGVYFFNAGVVGVRDGADVFLHRIVDAMMFRVQPEEDLNVAGVVDFSASTATHDIGFVDDETQE